MTKEEFNERLCDILMNTRVDDFVYSDISSLANKALEDMQLIIYSKDKEIKALRKSLDYTKQELLNPSLKDTK